LKPLHGSPQPFCKGKAREKKTRWMPSKHRAIAAEGWRKPACFRCSATFTVPHRSPGALADVLECFRRFGLNLTSINSLPSLMEPFQYLFFVEFEGSRFGDADGRVRRALEDVAKVAQTWRWLGSWVDQREASDSPSRGRSRPAPGKPGERA